MRSAPDRRGYHYGGFASCPPWAKHAQLNVVKKKKYKKKRLQPIVIKDEGV